MSTTSIRATEKLSIKEQAEKGVLPASLLLNDIVELWTSDVTGQKSIRKAMLENYENGALIAENPEENSGNGNLKVHRDSFKTWLTQLRKKPITNCFHDDCLLANWWADEAIESNKTKAPLNTIQLNEALSFYEAYRELEKRLANLTYIEFGLFVFDSGIRIFDKRPDDEGNLKQLPGCGELNEVGIADTISRKITPLNLTLSKFRYSKEDIDRLIPSYRYICFDDACKEIAYFSNKPEEEIKDFLINKAQYESISPYHPYCGFAHPEHEDLWPDSAYPDDIINQILCDDFGISEYECAFDIEIYLNNLKAKSNSDDEVNRIRKIIDRRIESSATLLEKQNSIAEIASLRLGIDKYHKDANKILNESLPDMPISPNHSDRVMRYVWLHELEAEYKRVYKTTWCPERDEKLKQINERIDEINRQLGVVDDSINDLKKQDIVNDIGYKNNRIVDKKKATVNSKFSSFKNLCANQISLVMMEGGKAKVVINKKPIDISPSDFGLKGNSQGWKLLGGAALAGGDLESALRTLNKSSNRKNETTKIRTAINRLNNKLKISLGLQENPILFDTGSYRFIFKAMTHELINGLNVTKDADAMSYLSGVEPEEANPTEDFWNG